jgi:mevalonate kinase
MPLYGNTFHAKIMLFGEYSVLAGSSAALIPYNRYSASLVIPGLKPSGNNATESNNIIRAFLGFLTGSGTGFFGQYIDLLRLRIDVEKGLYCQSPIPQKYGLGSSGALCAAIFSAYHKETVAPSDLPLADLHSILARMESFFHGSSSGVDPLVIFLNEPLAIINGEYLKPRNNGLRFNTGITIFLLDTELPGETANGLKAFQKLMNKENYKKNFREQYIPLINRLVSEWIIGKLSVNTIMDLSGAQEKLLRPMIPDAYRELWVNGITSGKYSLKLCGSGGGGMILGFTGNVNETRNYLWGKYHKEIEIVG